MKGDKERWILNEGEEECARVKDRGSGEIDSWRVRGDLVSQSQNKENRRVIVEEAVYDYGLVVGLGLLDKPRCGHTHFITS